MFNYIYVPELVTYGKLNTTYSPLLVCWFDFLSLTIMFSFVWVSVAPKITPFQILSNQFKYINSSISISESRKVVWLYFKADIFNKVFLLYHKTITDITEQNNTQPLYITSQPESFLCNKTERNVYMLTFLTFTAHVGVKLTMFLFYI